MTSIHARPGRIEVALDESRGTGFHWVLSSAPPAVHRIAEWTTPPSAAHGTGGVGARLFQFDVAAPGVFELRFELKRAWEATPRQEKIVQLIVEASAPRRS